MKSPKRAVITGGTGFIGSHLTRELLSCGYNVILYGLEEPKSSQVKCIIGDIQDRERLQTAVREADIVFHLAAAVGTSYLVERSMEADHINIGGTLNLLSLARELGFTVVDVGVIPRWRSPYMITKKAAAEFGAMYHAEFQTDVRTLELSHVYGPGQKVEPYYKAIPTFIEAALQDRPLTIFGQGRRPMDCVYVEDVVKALRMVGESETMAGKIVPFGSGEAITVLELARRIVAATDSKSSIVFAPMRAGEPDDGGETDLRGVDLSSWLEYFDWRPQTTLEDGLISTIESYRMILSAAR